MSRRVYFKQATIRDREIAIEGLNLEGVKYDVQGDRIHMVSGALRGAYLNLKTGEIRGDSDYGHTEQSLSVLRQYYAEAQYRRECAKNGTTVEQREVTENGDLVLHCHNQQMAV